MFFHFIYCHIRICVCIIVERHGYVFVPHNILQGFGVHSCMGKFGAECVSQAVGRKWDGKYFLGMLFIVFFCHPSENTGIVHSGSWLSVSCGKEKGCDTKVAFALV